MAASSARSSHNSWTLKRPSQNRPLQPSSALAARATGSARHFIITRTGRPGGCAARQAFRLLEQGISLADAGGFGVFARREHAHPSVGDIDVRPCTGRRRLDLQHQVQVVAHHGVGVDGDCEGFGQKRDALLDPVLAMFEGLAGVAILPAQEGAAHAALHAMEGAALAGGISRERAVVMAPVLRPTAGGAIGKILRSGREARELCVSYVFLWTGIGPRPASGGVRRRRANSRRELRPPAPPSVFRTRECRKVRWSPMPQRATLAA